MRRVICILVFCLVVVPFASLAEDMDYLKADILIGERMDMPVPGVPIYLESGRYLVFSQYCPPYIYRTGSEEQVFLTAHEDDARWWAEQSDDRDYQESLEEKGPVYAWFMHGAQPRYTGHQRVGDHMLVDLNGIAMLVDLENARMRPAEGAVSLLEDGRYIRCLFNEKGYSICRADGTAEETVDVSGLLPQDARVTAMDAAKDTQVYLIFTGKIDFSGENPNPYYLAWSQEAGAPFALTWLGNYAYPRKPGPQRVMLLGDGSRAVVWSDTGVCTAILAEKGIEAARAMEWDGAALKATPLDEAADEKGKIPAPDFDRLVYPIGGSAEGRYVAFWGMDGILMTRMDTLETTLLLDEEELQRNDLFSAFSVSAAFWDGSRHITGVKEHILSIQEKIEVDFSGLIETVMGYAGEQAGKF